MRLLGKVLLWVGECEFKPDTHSLLLHLQIIRRIFLQSSSTRLLGGCGRWCGLPLYWNFIENVFPASSSSFPCTGEYFFIFPTRVPWLTWRINLNMEYMQIATTWKDFKHDKVMNFVASVRIWGLLEVTTVKVKVSRLADNITSTNGRLCVTWTANVWIAPISINWIDPKAYKKIRLIYLLLKLETGQIG